MEFDDDLLRDPTLNNAIPGGFADVFRGEDVDGDAFCMTASLGAATQAPPAAALHALRNGAATLPSLHDRTRDDVVPEVVSDAKADAHEQEALLQGPPPPPWGDFQQCKTPAASLSAEIVHCARWLAPNAHERALRNVAARRAVIGALSCALTAAPTIPNTAPSIAQSADKPDGLPRVPHLYGAYVCPIASAAQSQADDPITVVVVVHDPLAAHAVAAAVASARAPANGSLPTAPTPTAALEAAKQAPPGTVMIADCAVWAAGTDTWTATSVAPCASVEAAQLVADGADPTKAGAALACADREDCCDVPALWPGVSFVDVVTRVALRGAAAPAAAPDAKRAQGAAATESSATGAPRQRSALLLSNVSPPRRLGYSNDGTCDKAAGVADGAASPAPAAHRSVDFSVGGSRTQTGVSVSGTCTTTGLTVTVVVVPLPPSTFAGWFRGVASQTAQGAALALPHAVIDPVADLVVGASRYLARDRPSLHVGSVVRVLTECLTQRRLVDPWRAAVPSVAPAAADLASPAASLAATPAGSPASACSPAGSGAVSPTPHPLPLPIVTTRDRDSVPPTAILPLIVHVAFAYPHLGCPAQLLLAALVLLTDRSNSDGCDVLSLDGARVGTFALRDTAAVVVVTPSFAAYASRQLASMASAQGGQGSRGGRGPRPLRPSDMASQVNAADAVVSDSVAACIPASPFIRFAYCALRMLLAPAGPPRGVGASECTPDATLPSRRCSVLNRVVCVPTVRVARRAAMELITIEQ